MSTDNNTLQTKRRFDGYRMTPFLWNTTLEGLSIFKPKIPAVNGYPEVDEHTHIRLGKLTEQFVLFELAQVPALQLLQFNVQIFKDQVTIGELDCLIKDRLEFMHLEMVYKFYLYDPSIPQQLERWIGPNRKDSLVQKLNKLKKKQLPLLYHPETVKTLEALHLNPADFQQRLYFKAQLFVPLNYAESSTGLINKECIKGFYLRLEDLALLRDCSFHIPEKLDWLVAPYNEVTWYTVADFIAIASQELARQRSPLCWMKSPVGKLQKFFLVWWD